MLKNTVLVVLLILLVGCSSYIDKMDSHVHSMQTSVQEVGIFLDSPSKYSGDIDEELENIIYHAEAIKQYDGVPDEYVSLHYKVGKAATYYKYGAEQLLLVRDGGGSDTELYEAIESFSRGTTILTNIK